ncbi:AIM24 family protein [Geopseudomonas aromaticivorans]
MNENLTVTERHESPGVLLEEVQYSSLKGSSDLGVAEKIFLANQAEIRLKMIKATLKGGSIRIEPGALHFMKGDLALESNVGSGGVARGLMRKFLTGETLFQTTIKGTGEVYLEPTFGHFCFFNFVDDALIFDKGAYFCSSGDIEVNAKMQKNISSGLFGGEGLFQTEARGSGIVVLNSPVPACELITYELAAGEKLSVDGNFALARTAGVTFRAEKSAKSLFQSVASGEVLLQTFTGPGIVWIAPTQGVYDQIRAANIMSALNAAPGSSGTNS